MMLGKSTAILKSEGGWATSLRSPPLVTHPHYPCYSKVLEPPKTMSVAEGQVLIYNSVVDMSHSKNNFLSSFI